MKIFHALGKGFHDGADLPILRFSSARNFLISPATYSQIRSWQKNLPELHRQKGRIICDSGLIGWINQLGIDAWDKFAIEPERILNLQIPSDPTVICSVDVLCVDELLKIIGKTRKEAIAQTVKNAAFLKSYPLPGKIKCYGIQGWDLSDYTACANAYKALGFFESDPLFTWFGIGSVKNRTPESGLIEVCQHVRQLVPSQFHVHVFGIGSPRSCLFLNKIGINSVDASTASIAGGRGYTWIDEGGRLRSLTLRHRSQQMRQAMIAFNMASLEAQIEESGEPDPANLLDLLRWQPV